MMLLNMACVADSYLRGRSKYMAAVIKHAERHSHDIGLHCAAIEIRHMLSKLGEFTRKSLQRYPDAWRELAARAKRKNTSPSQSLSAFDQECRDYSFRKVESDRVRRCYEAAPLSGAWADRFTSMRRSQW